MKIKLKTNSKVILGDYLTPIAIYEKLRGEYPNSLLLESSDYHAKENHYSYICCEPIAKFSVEKKHICIQYPNAQENKTLITHPKEVLVAFAEFQKKFEVQKQDYPFVTGGFFGFSSFDAVQYFEDIQITKKIERIPEMLYQLFRFVMVFDHFQDKLFFFEYQSSAQNTGDDFGINHLLNIIENKKIISSCFQAKGKEHSNYSDEQFLEIIKKGIWHCQRGDVFQVVLSRKFFQEFEGDEWNVYRVLRSINPSPYLFYFSYDGFKIFGSSPEAQIIIKGDEAVIYPIAGTFRRSGNDTQDAKLAKELFDNEKENAEHCMLVDLARNDLSKQSQNVQVAIFKEIQYYSHVIHMVSKVVGKIENTNFLQFFADTFPAGTLSGAPKYRAMEIINNLETSNREFYGGAIGFFGFGGEVNHAIIIRTIFSYQGVLHYQAGGGIVCLSNQQSELQEANNKRAALKLAIEKASQDFSRKNNENFSFR